MDTLQDVLSALAMMTFLIAAGLYLAGAFA